MCTVMRQSSIECGMTILHPLTLSSDTCQTPTWLKSKLWIYQVLFSRSKTSLERPFEWYLTPFEQYLYHIFRLEVVFDLLSRFWITSWPCGGRTVPRHWIYCKFRPIRFWVTPGLQRTWWPPCGNRASTNWCSGTRIRLWLWTCSRCSVIRTYFWHGYGSLRVLLNPEVATSVWNSHNFGPGNRSCITSTRAKTVK